MIATGVLCGSLGLFTLNEAKNIAHEKMPKKQRMTQHGAARQTTSIPAIRMMDLKCRCVNLKRLGKFGKKYREKVLERGKRPSAPH